MRAWRWSLLAAMLPWMGPAESPSMLLRPMAPPCAVALDVRLEAPLRWGAIEWRLFTREVEQAWTPYGITICWQGGEDRCEGFVGRIPFCGEEPGTEIFLSIEGGRYLVTHATLGARKVGLAGRDCRAPAAGGHGTRARAPGERGEGAVPCLQRST
jgi:hypothetical protein